MRALRLAVPVLAAVLALVAPGVAAAHELPVPYSLLPGITQQTQAPDTPPPGANDWSCKPSAKHPNPVVLLHGLMSNQTVNWQTFAPLLHNNGYCVFTLTYGKAAGAGLPGYEPGGLIRMEGSAKQLSAFVDKVRARTGAAKVDLLGHSEGTIMPAYYVRFLGGGAKVGRYVSLTPLWEGSSVYGLSTLFPYLEAFGLDSDLLLGQFCQSCKQFNSGSDYLKKLHAKGMFDPRIRYTNIVTRYDELVTPYTSGIARGPNITNVVLQDKCWLDFSDHAAVMYSPNAAGYVLNALDPAHAKPVPCTLTTPAGAL